MEEVFTGMNLPPSHIELGMVELDATLNEKQKNQLQEKLSKRGFELIYDRQTQLVNLVKSTVINYIQHLEESEQPEKLSHFITTNTNYNYSYLSNIFSDVSGITIENYLIELKIERVKELLSFQKWTLSEIAWKLKYSSVQYLSNQFKKTTGVTVTDYRKQKIKDRRTFDQF